MKLTEYLLQVISILLEKYSLPELAEKIVFIAGHKVTNDPVAIPFSMVRHWYTIHTLFCSNRDVYKYSMTCIDVVYFSLSDFICISLTLYSFVLLHFLSYFLFFFTDFIFLQFVSIAFNFFIFLQFFSSLQLFSFSSNFFHFRWQGRNLLCIHSKKHIKNPPEEFPMKSAQNLATMKVSESLTRSMLFGNALFFTTASKNIPTSEEWCAYFEVRWASR